MRSEKETIIIVNCGSRYIRDLVSSVESEGLDVRLVPPDIDTETIRQYAHEGSLKGIIISGMLLNTPSIFEVPAILPEPGILTTGVPVLGICYGHQYMAYVMGGTVERGSENEIGLRKIYIQNGGKLLRGVHTGTYIKLEHRDVVTSVPAGFSVLAHTDISPIAAYEWPELGLYGTQFHPERVETQGGRTIMRNFLFEIACCTRPVPCTLPAV